MQAIRWMHYNLAGDHFIAVYGSHIAQVVGIELSMFEAGLLQTEQLSILGSAWCEGRQELVTAGGDGTLLFACLRHEYQITTNGRRLLSRLAPRMTISSGYMWMRQLCIDEAVWIRLRVRLLRCVMQDAASCMTQEAQDVA